ncbi:unnamed protein product [Didymodactylos carnosus]|nr:unnamed protein product [Didymodactylos carnosus]CAF3942950.1 unnamed protein product [Didymodactylos carnosus]
MTSISVMMTVFVLNLHYRGPKRNELPFWLQQLLGLSLAGVIRTVRTSGCSWMKKDARRKVRNTRYKSRSSHLNKFDSFVPTNGISYKLNETVIKQENVQSTTYHSADYESLRYRDNLSDGLDNVNKRSSSRLQHDSTVLKDNHSSSNYRPFSDNLSVPSPPTSIQRSSSTIQEEIHQTLHSLLLKQKQIERDLQIASDWRSVATKSCALPSRTDM